jgi:NADH-quinone oxidoreductase subunit G
VRFTAEVSKTNELRIVHRGDRSEIGTNEDKPLDNNYSVNAVDICPVGALTSKDFRFRQRVWYLKNADTICTGCSTGCNVKVYYNEEGTFRVKPNHNEKVNGHWMCDQGRHTYKFVNREHRLVLAKTGSKNLWSQVDPVEATIEAGKYLRESAQKNLGGIAVVVTGQYTNEEYGDLLQFVAEDLRVKNIYHWINNPEDMDGFDGLLFRGDRNPNTAGLKASLSKHKVGGTWPELVKNLEEGKVDCLLVVGPADNSVFPDLAERLKLFSKAKKLIFLTSAKSEALDSSTTTTYQIPMKVYFEKDGTYTNYAGLDQKTKRGATFVAKALTLSEAVSLLSGKELQTKLRATPEKHNKENYFTTERGSL